MYKILKRMLDLVSSSLLLLLISPFFVALMVMIAAKIGRPIFFKQQRSGKNMKEFMMIKFRTMTRECDETGLLLPDNQRQTQFGLWLRSNSLDELPELLNIIKGDMSVIGPRPLPPIYNKYYTEYEKNRFLVKGGLITPGSIDDEPIISWSKQFIYESDYAVNLSFKTDLKLFFSVFRMLFYRRKTSYGSFVRMPLDVERNKIINNE